MGLRMFLASKVSRIFLEVASALVVLAYQPYRPIVFVGTSMAPTYGNLEMALASTDVENVDRGDIVVIDKVDGVIVKRVAYVAGDKIDYFKVGGEWLCGLETTFDKQLLSTRFPHRQLRVPYGYVFVLGDNWVESRDSRHFGPVPVSAISAKLANSRARVPLPGEYLASKWRRSPLLTSLRSP